jgi:quinol monooxygenase YgiN
MANLLVRHKVEDYGKWKEGFDKHSATRAASGSQGYRLLRNADNPNEIVIIFGWDDLERARRFASSDDLRAVMHDAGVIDRPDVYFLDKEEQGAK